MPNPETAWNHGDVVRDREDDDPDPAIVVNTPGAPADEWDISRLDKTVAEDNPDYPSDVEIVTVVYEENLREAFPNWTANNALKKSISRPGTRRRFDTSKRRSASGRRGRSRPRRPRTNTASHTPKTSGSWSETR